MKTIVTLFIALLSFASTLAWAGPETPGSAAGQQVQTQTAAPQHKAQRSQGAPGARSAQSAQNTPGAVQPGTSNSHSGPAAAFTLPTGPAVLCACVIDRTLG